jgi:sugar lactone lactonase YvrE
MMKRIQARPQWQRVTLFVSAIVLVALILYGITLAVAWYGLNGTPRPSPVAIQENVTVREFAQLPDDNAYPAALALDNDGFLYTGSYVTGAIWQITPDGEAVEIPGTRDTYGSITALSITPGKTLYVFDRNEPLKPAGAAIWQMTMGSAPEKLVEIPAQDNSLPYDMAVDAARNMYATIVVDGDVDYVARYAPDGRGGVWWTAPEDATITGIAFDAANQRMLVTDTRQSVIYGLAVDAAESPEAQEVYRYNEQPPQPGFDGLTVAPNGDIYIAVLGRNRAARLIPATGELTYLAGAFRGSSRVAYDANRERLYVNNWDQRSLLPGERVLIVEIPLNPRLPFTIDVVEPKQG